MSDLSILFWIETNGHVRIFNMGSPRNVPAGQGGANLDKLIAHYQKINSDEERRAKALATKEYEKK